MIKSLEKSTLYPQLLIFKETEAVSPTSEIFSTIGLSNAWPSSRKGWKLFKGTRISS